MEWILSRQSIRDDEIAEPLTMRILLQNYQQFGLSCYTLLPQMSLHGDHPRH